MSEEMNERESALSDAELESVSGAGHDDEFYAIRRCAEGICKRCDLLSGRPCSGDPYKSLVAYLKAHGIDSVGDYRYCPYYIP